MKLKVTESQADQLGEMRRRLFPTKTAADPVPSGFIDAAREIIGASLEEAYKREAAGEKIEVVVVPDPPPRAAPKMSEAMRKRLEAGEF